MQNRIQTRWRRLRLHMQLGNEWPSLGLFCGAQLAPRYLHTCVCLAHSNGRLFVSWPQTLPFSASRQPTRAAHSVTPTMSHKSEHHDLQVHDELVYSAISSNRNEKNISFEEGYLLYSRCRCPIVYNVRDQHLAACLTGHTDEVNGQCFVNRQDASDSQEMYLISTAHDNSAIIWQLSNPDARGTFGFKILHNIQSPDGSLFQTRCSLKLKDQVFLSILTTIDGNIYLCENDSVTQTIATKNCYFDAKFYSTEYVIDTENTKERHLCRLLTLAGSDNKVHIYLLTDQRRLVHLMDLAGFNDWIKCLDLMPLAARDNEFLLAAACQDSLIQVWHLRLTCLTVDEATRVRTSVSEAPCGEGHMSNVRLTATLETVLAGHEGFVYSLCWLKQQQHHYSEGNLLQLYSCSADRTIIVWESRVANRQWEAEQKYEQHPASEGFWKQVAQLGETGEANLPLLGICLSHDGGSIYAHSYRGAIHVWNLDRSKGEGGRTAWTPAHSITGHFDAVTDIVWSPFEGRYLLSASLDKTCRLHGLAHEDKKWHELARPQVHGFEINCLAPLSSIKFASGAEEKTIRAFEATQFFVKNFEALTRTQLPLVADCCNDKEQVKLEELPAHAQLPALGLSNRGSEFAFDVYDGEDRSNDGDKAKQRQQQQQQQTPDSVSSGGKMMMMNLSDNNSWHEVSKLARQLAATDHLDAIPCEEILLQSTLWWEKNKLFGHCNELHALASTSDGKFLASASKANRPDLAAIIIWETGKFRKVATLEHHSLTITRLRFSPDDSHLLSVSRDRTWCLFERDPKGQLRNAYRKVTGTVKSGAVHERIIWDCAWTHDSRYFCTVSRDKKAIVWSLDRLRSEGAENDAGASVLASKLFDQSIQAIDSPSVASEPSAGAYLFALGFEDGSLELLHLLSVAASSQTTRRPGDARDSPLEWRLLKRFGNFHQLSVKRLSFQPSRQQQQQQQQSENNKTSRQSRRFLLASGADDCVLKLTELRISRREP